jgi:hypothetical protein
MAEDKDAMCCSQKSWWRRIFGRSILRVLIGDFFADKNNVASMIALMLVSTLCYLIVFEKQHDYNNSFFNVIFVVVGYYFGSKRAKGEKED